MGEDIARMIFKLTLEVKALAALRNYSRRKLKSAFQKPITDKRQDGETAQENE